MNVGDRGSQDWVARDDRSEESVRASDCMELRTYEEHLVGHIFALCLGSDLGILTS